MREEDVLSEQVEKNDNQKAVTYIDKKRRA